MAVIVKCGPARIEADGATSVTVPPYRGAQPVIGDEVFIWIAETEGGEGLARRGHVRSVTTTRGKDLVLMLALTDERPSRGLTKAMLRPHRNSQDPGPMASLAWKLYGHSLRKVAELDPGEAQFLANHFDQRQDLVPPRP